ncbi:hypothetical protein R4B61_07675 (plasmid) [Fructilactobacillus vespulae]|uniref:hypothetical protein n=1 Tax=Fructilactobacillus vespulae TaxID=1249630 RepID=UPI0039B468FB
MNKKILKTLVNVLDDIKKIIFFFIKGSFSSMNSQFLIKSYFTATAIVGILIYLNRYHLNTTFSDPFIIEWFIISWILYPFANLFWNDLIVAINRNTVWIINGCLLLIWKPIKLFLLFMFAPLIAPLGLMYIWINYKR